jgi:predicted ATPase
MIEEITIKGFKSLRDVTWRPKPLNILIGENGSGKTNLLQALQLVQASAIDDVQSQLQKWGGIQNVVWNNDAGGTLNIKIIYKEDESKLYEYEIEFLKKNELQISDIPSEKLTINGEIVENIGHPFDGTNLPIFGSFRYGNNISKPLTIGRLTAIGLMQSVYVISQLETSPTSPARSRYQSREGSSLQENGSTFAAFVETQYKNNTVFKKKFDEAMLAAFGEEYESLEFMDAGQGMKDLAIKWKSLKLPKPAFALSDGTLKFLFLVAALIQPFPPRLICIEEPEIGLHPKMLSIIADYAKQAVADGKTQIIFTTHSVEFLNKFSDVPDCPTIVAMENGETKLFQVPPEKLQHWLKRYELGTIWESGRLEAML